ncbi:hypothetical protein GCM10010912_57890 [Paenibacillus albidus]|uniref:Uncharacterized protein n=1 Tax=Paenibacillus albidus TaxID=2041023 RepID=A0A917FVX3_9BACL|nr:hypothetical protein [Paenibacillus albidus]GGG05656.1 hypothetical protein GCM10010912_57890 [Paenibacillus albidus]
MLNIKKLELAYKRYSENFVDGIKFEDVREYYETNKQEIIEIVELNDKEKDHILLINLGSIFSYYLSTWKNDVLINGGNKADGLKQMQMVVFYQCMIQDLYKVRYPNMRVRYTFREVIAALIHFTMYGWEKEENLLFDFMVDHLGGNIMEANDRNKHTWFLLELYLKYRNKTIVGTNQNVHIAVKRKLEEAGLRSGSIPLDLEIYHDVLERWSTPSIEEIEQLIVNMTMFHSTLASELGSLNEFGDYRYGFYPYEILFLIHIRNKLELPVPKHYDDLLMSTSEAKMQIEDLEPFPEWDPLLRLIDNFYRKNYPEYIPNQHGELFQ